jgi:uncharacterized coiled-coil protein SlyX
MSYIVTGARGMGTVGSAATTGAQTGGQAGGGSGVNVGGVIGSAGSALTSIVGGAINLANNIGLWRQQRRDVAGAREDAWAAEVDALNYDNLLAAQSAEELAAQNAAIEEQNRVIAEQERVLGHEQAALQAQIRRAEIETARRQRAAEAMRFRMPTWGWFALAGVGVLAIAGAGAYMGLKSEES